MTQLLALALTLVVSAQSGQQAAPDGQERVPSNPDLPFNLPGTPVVQTSAGPYWVLPNGDIGPRLPADGRWASLPHQPDTALPPSRVRIVLVRETLLYGPDAEGSPVARRASLSQPHLHQIQDAAALLTRLAASLDTGPANVQVDIQEDRELYYFPSVPYTPEAAQDRSINDWIYKNIVQTKTNIANFESDDPTDFGPFDLVVVLHSAQTQTTSTYSNLGRNVVVTPYFSLQGDPVAALAGLLAESWLANRPETTVAKTIPGDPGSLTLQVAESHQALVTSSPNASAFRASDNNFITPTETPKTTLEALGYTPQPPTTSFPYSGSFSLTTENDVINVNLRPWMAFGYAVLPVQPPTDLDLTVSAELQGFLNAPLALQFLSASGQILRTVQVSGPDNFAWPQTERAMVTPAEGWQPLTAVVRGLSEPVAQIRLVPFPSPEQSRYLSTALELKIRNLQIQAAQESDQTVVPYPPPPAQTFQAEFQDAPAVLPASAWNRLQDAFTSNDTQLQIAAARLLTRSKSESPEAVPALKALAQSASEEALPIATQALAHQDTPEAWAALKEIIEKGPFTINRLAAWRHLESLPKDQSWIRIATVLSTQTSWPSRQIGIEIHSQIDEELSRMAVLAGFQDYEPAIRLATANHLDPTQDFFARRLIYAAVNDSCEAVRAACLIRLLDTPIERIRTEAHRGVRDDSIAVRIALIQAVQQRANPQDRPVLQLAVTDTNDQVVAAALDAFATQPDPVQPAEIQSAFDTQSPLVARTLLKLAISKNITLPEATQNTFRKFPDPEIQKLLNEIRP